MHKFSVIVACFTCAGHSRRVHTAIKRSQYDVPKSETEKLENSTYHPAGHLKQFDVRLANSRNALHKHVELLLEDVPELHNAEVSAELVNLISDPYFYEKAGVHTRAGWILPDLRRTKCRGKRQNLLELARSASRVLAGFLLAFNPAPAFSAPQPAACLSVRLPLRYEGSRMDSLADVWRKATNLNSHALSTSKADARSLIKEARLDGKTFTVDEVEALVQKEVHRAMTQQLLAPTPELLQETFTPNDPVHGLIHLPLVVKAIVDTRVFQRMRNIRQLGICSHVYPGATHNRFFHSIGTAFLAYELMKGLKHRQPELRITDRDVLCVTLAALCHDLGHPCFSHMFETFIHELGHDMRAEAELDAEARGVTVSSETLEQIKRYETWSHEDASVRLLDVVFEEVREPLLAAGLRVDMEGDDFTCIRELIDPPKRKLEDLLLQGELHREWSKHIKGRPVEKAWLYEVVSNWRSGIDVDKFDYFRRDALYLGIHKEFDHFRYLKSVRVLPDNIGVPTISPPDKEKDAIRENMLELRKSLHRSAYQHKTAKKLEMHMIDILKMMDPHVQITGTGGQKFTMSEAAVEFDSVAYQKLTDAFVESKLFEDEEPAMHEAALEYNRRIISREMMTLIADWDVDSSMAQVAPLVSEDVIDGILESYAAHASTVKPGETVLAVTQQELRCEVCSFHYGMRGEDPIRRVLFHSSKDSSLKSHLSDTDGQPMKQKVFVFWNPSQIEKTDPAYELTHSRLTFAFEQWARKSGDGMPYAELLSPSRIARGAELNVILQDTAAEPEVAKAVALLASHMSENTTGHWGI